MHANPQHIPQEEVNIPAEQTDDEPAPTLPVDPDAEPDAPARNPAVNMTAKVPHAPIRKEKKREIDREHDIAPDERDSEDDGVIGEVEQPAAPSEKPEAS